MAKPRQILREALYEAGFVQPLDSSSKGKSVSFLCRQIPGQERAWLAVVDQLLGAAETGAFDLHLCRRYLRKNGSMVFGWHLGVEAKSAPGLVEATDAIVKVLKEASSNVLPVAPALRRRPQYKEESPDAIKQALAQDGVEGVLERRPPRQPEYHGPDPVAPMAVVHSIRKVSSGVDSAGQVVSVEEMPLPHVYRDLNKPKPGSTKGATSCTGERNGPP